MEQPNRRKVLGALFGTAAAAASSEASAAFIDTGEGEKMYIRDEDVREFTDLMRAITEINERQQKAGESSDIEAQRRILQEVTPLLEKAQLIMQRSHADLEGKK